MIKGSNATKLHQVSQDILKGDINNELSSIQPVLETAKAAVGLIKAEHLTELRSLKMPPEPISDVLGAVLKLLGISDVSWTSMKKFLGNRGVKDEILNYTKLYSLNKTSEIEDGLSAVLGFDFKINKKDNGKEKLSLSLGQVFNHEKNRDIPSKSSLDQKMSDIVGKINYNFYDSNWNFVCVCMRR